jgi:hypothetical protein
VQANRGGWRPSGPNSDKRSRGDTPRYMGGAPAFLTLEPFQRRAADSGKGDARSPIEVHETPPAIHLC